MGRVASKRKLKACDPFFKGRREGGKKAKDVDLPPTQSKRAKKRQRQQLSDSAIEQFVLRSSAVGGSGGSSNAISVADGDAQGGEGGGKKRKKNQQLKVGSIREGESMRAFNKRISTEVKRVISDETKKGRRASEKRKAFLAKKKQKAQDRKLTDQERYEREFQATGSTKRDTFEGVERVKFGERVDAPPIMPKLTGAFKKRALALEDAKKRKVSSLSASIAGGGQRAGKKAKQTAKRARTQ